MHSTVYEISNHPVPIGKQATPGYLPNWFFDSICKYATEMSEAEREQSIQNLTDHFEGLCSRNGNQLTFSPELKQAYFRKNHEFFRTAAKALARTEYDVFAGITPAPAFDLAMQAFTESYADKFGFYVYTPETAQLSSLDNWLRNADTSKPFYVGGTIDYHC